MGIVLKENALILDDNDATERNAKEQEYLDYINTHIGNVRKAFMMYIAPLVKCNHISDLISDEELKKAIAMVYQRLDQHDASKFSDSEFDGYRAKWYPTEREKNYDQDFLNTMEDRYEEAWKHHYQNNPHHPKHWVDPETGVPRDMSLDAIIEMICDIASFSLTQGSSTLEWWENDAEDEKKCLSPKSKQIIEDLLYNVIFNTQENQTNEPEETTGTEEA